MIIHHSCGHFSRMDGAITRDMLGTYRRLVCPACAAAAKVPSLIEHPIAGGGWVQHMVGRIPVAEQPIAQGPPSRQQLRNQKRREAWHKAKQVKSMPRRERRALAKQMAQGGAE
jgi:hypothetical protein